MIFSKENVCAVVITYFPDYKFPERLKKIYEQVDKIICVDNCTTGKEISNIHLALNGKQNIEMIKNRKNLGVANALNQGVKRAIEKGFSWVVTFDQDSIPQADMVKKMLEVWKAYPDQEKLMIAGPQTIFPNCSSGSNIFHEDKPWQEVTHIITSGSLIPKKAFQAVGFFLDSLFIDYVDIEFCLRLRSRGYRAIQVTDAILLHDLGHISEHHIFGRQRRATHHEPVRRYYQFRNSLLLHKVYKKIQAEWCRGNKIILLKIIGLILLYERRRLRKVAQISKGIFHGLLGRAGKKGEIYFNIDDRTI